MAVSSIGGGCLHPPHITPPEKTATSRYYAENIQSAAVFPGIRDRVMSWGGRHGRRAWMQDHATPQTAAETHASPESEKVRNLPWVANGADCNPLAGSQNGVGRRAWPIYSL